MSHEPVRSSMPSPTQVEKLVDILEVKPAIAMGYARTPSSKTRHTIAWQEIAQILNCMANGTNKTWVQWLKYWRDKKGAVKRKAFARYEASKKGSDAAEEMPSLSPIEERILSIMGGSRIASGDPHLAINPFHESENTSNAPTGTSTDNTGSSESIHNCHMIEPPPILIEIVDTMDQSETSASPSQMMRLEYEDSNISPSPSLNMDSDNITTENQPVLSHKEPPADNDQKPPNIPPHKRRRLLRRHLKPTPQRKRSKINLIQRLVNIQERQITLEERRCENESHIIKILDNLQQAWTNQSRSLVNVTEALNVLVERIKFN